MQTAVLRPSRRSSGYQALHLRTKRRPQRLRITAIVLAGLIGSALLAAILLVQFDQLRFEPVLSGSMRPGIQPGSLAVLDPVPVSHLRVGEIISYLPPGHTTPVMHRIFSIDSHGIVTKGDANPSVDPWGRVQPPGSTVEHLVTVLPGVGWLAGVRIQIMVGIGIALLLVLLAVVWIAPERDEKEEGGTPPLD